MTHVHGDLPRYLSPVDDELQYACRHRIGGHKTQMLRTTSQMYSSPTKLT